MSSRRSYEELCIIGRGAYGTVFKAKDTVNDRIVALKRVCIVNNTEEKGVPVSTLREITLLKQLDNMSHPNIVRMFDAFQTFSSSASSSSSSVDSPQDVVLTIVFEHVEQDLSTFIHKSQPCGLSEEVIKNLMHQLLCGIDYLHTNRMIHRDIKPQNILITRNKQVKIADFGLARVYGFCKLVTSVVVTLWYRAPEILLRAPYAMMVDLWSVGTIMAEMYNRRPLFRGKSDVNQLHNILSVIGSPEKKEWPEQVSLPWDSFCNYPSVNLQTKVPDMCVEGIDLISKLLLFDPNKRINAKKCLSHAYFDDVDGLERQDSGLVHDINCIQKLPSEYTKETTKCNPLLTPTISHESATISINVDDEISECEIVLPCPGQEASSREDGSSRGSDSGLGNLTKTDKERASSCDVDRLNASFHDTSFHETCSAEDGSETLVSAAISLAKENALDVTGCTRTLTRSDSGLGVSPHPMSSQNETRQSKYCDSEVRDVSQSGSSRETNHTTDHDAAPLCTFKTKDTAYTNIATLEAFIPNTTTTATTTTCTSDNFHSYILDKENLDSPVKTKHSTCEKRQPCHGIGEPGEDDTLNLQPLTKRFCPDEASL